MQGKNLHYTTGKHHLRYSRGKNNNKYRHHSLIFFIFFFVMLGMSCQRSQSAWTRDISPGAPSSPADTHYPTCFSLVHLGKKNVYLSYLITTLFTTTGVARWVNLPTCALTASSDPAWKYVVCVLFPYLRRRC